MLEYQRCVAEINLDAIGHNIREIKARLNEGTRLLAVVKADGYGHGATETAQICLYNGADELAVATLDEGLALRSNNIFVPVLILGYTVESRLEDAVTNNLTQTVFSYELAKQLSVTAVRLGRTALAHISVDTGMSRIGFLPCEESLDEIDRIFELPNLEITGVFTHFSTADEADKSFTYTQFERFKYMTDGIEARGHKNLIRHCANSASIIDLPDMQLDMVRAGIIIYGMLPSGDVGTDIDLIPAMSIKTHISYVKELPAGIGVGYGRKYYTDKLTKIATVPIGYADGYSRRLSNKARMLVNGEYANVIGNVCMDQLMLDVTHIKDVKMGDEVTVLGVCGDKAVSAEELGSLMGTINYEVVCCIGKRVPRVYIKNNAVLKTVAY